MITKIKKDWAKKLIFIIAVIILISLSSYFIFSNNKQSATKAIGSAIVINSVTLGYTDVDGNGIVNAGDSINISGSASYIGIVDGCALISPNADLRNYGLGGDSSYYEGYTEISASGDCSGPDSGTISFNELFTVEADIINGGINVGADSPLSAVDVLVSDPGSGNPPVTMLSNTLPVGVNTVPPEPPVSSITINSVTLGYTDLDGNGIVNSGDQINLSGSFSYTNVSGGCAIIAVEAGLQSYGIGSGSYGAVNEGYASVNYTTGGCADSDTGSFNESFTVEVDTLSGGINVGADSPFSAVNVEILDPGSSNPHEAMLSNTLPVGVNTTSLDVAPPQLLSARTISGNEVEVFFDEDLDESQLTTADFQVSIDGYGDYSISSLSEDNGKVTLFLDSDLANDTPIVTINPAGHLSIKDLSGNEQTAMMNVTAEDKAAPRITSGVLGSGDAGYELPYLGGSRPNLYGAALIFSEQLSEDSITAVQNALSNGADKELTFHWMNNHLRISRDVGEGDTATFTNDVWALLSDVSGNKGWTLLINTGTSLTTEVTNDTPQTISGDNQSLLVSSSLGTSDTVNVNVDLGSDNSQIDLGAFTSGGVASSIPEINITKTLSDGTVSVNIPSGTTITADGDTSWTGAMDVPQVTTLSLPGAVVDSAIDVGFADTKLTFNNPVKLTFEGKAGERIGYSRGGLFTEITTACINNLDDGQSWAIANLIENGSPEDCKISLDDGNLAVWTKHFTTFATYTSSAPSNPPPAYYNPVPNDEEGLEPPSTPQREEIIEQIQFQTQPIVELSPEEIARRAKLMLGTYDYQLIYQSPYPAEANPGDLIDVWIEVKNTGTATWFNNGNNVVRLGSGSSYGNINQQRDYVSEFANSNWLSANRAVAIMHPEIRPGWNTRFQFKLKAPATPGTYKAYFTPVVDGVKWMKDIGIYWQIIVK
ncbi:MAG: hypothetical protein PHU42_01835 [Patescibacteria group bacterium]|nr:hypothetical protein [Patescibacteria group bacterium]